MAISRIETNSIAPSQTLTTPIIATTMGVGGATPAGSGSGITFPAAQSASSDVNTLDDYEEGTWTPILQGSGADPTNVTYATQRGVYTKVGNLVSISFYLSFSTFTGGSGSFLVGGFPFTVKSTNDSNGAFKIENITLDAGRTYAVTTAVGTTAYATVHQVGSNTTWIGMTIGSNFTSSATVKYTTGQLTYQAA